MHERTRLPAVGLGLLLTLGFGLGLVPASAAQPEVRVHPARAQAPARIGLLGPSRGGPEAGVLAFGSAALLGLDPIVVFEPTDAAGAVVCAEPGIYGVGDVAVIRWSGPTVPGDAPSAFSPASLEGLRGSLEEAHAVTLLVAVDHAWWADASMRAAWGEVHALLAAERRVRAVLAVADGVMRDDGERDGIRYLGLPPSTGLGPPGLDRFTQPAVVLGIGDEGGWRFAVVDHGAVRGIEAVPGSEVDAALALRDAVSVRGFFAASPEGGSAGSVTLTLTNPTTDPVRYALGVDGSPGWAFSREQVSGTLDAGASETIEIEAVSPGLNERPTVEVRGQLRLPLASGGAQAVPVRCEIPVYPAVAPAAAGAVEPGASLRVDSRSGVVVELADQSGPFTIECRVRADDVSGEQTLLTAPGFSVIWAHAAGLTPSPAAVLTGPDGEPRSITSEDPTHHGENDGPGLTERWVHLALCVGSSTATLFLDGNPVGTAPAPTGFELRGPLVIGGRADEHGRVRDGFRGLIDELRVSAVVRYEGPFTPSLGFAADEQTALLLHFDRELGPVFADDSPSGSHGWGAGRARVDAGERSP